MKQFAKVLALLTALALVISLAACGDSKEEKKDDTKAAVKEATEAPADPLVGTWESNDVSGSYFVFNADGTGSMESAGISIGFAYTKEGDTLLISDNAGEENQLKYKYTIEGETLTMSDEDSDTELKYTKVEAIPTEAIDPDATENNSKLVGSWEYEADGVMATYTFNANGTGTIDGGTATVSFTYTDDGSSVSVSVGGQDPSPAAYTLEGDTLTITPDEGDKVVMTRKK